MTNAAPRGASFYIKRVLGIILLLALATVFLFSAYSKIGIEFHHFSVVDTPNNFDNFQWTFLSLGINSTLAAGIIARLFIGFEFMLAVFLVLHIFLKQFTYKAIIGLLIFFIAYLLYVLVKEGNNGNCGCFGDKITMTPWEAIFKNIVMIVVAVILMFIYPIRPYKNQEWVAVTVGMLALVLPFIINPLSSNNEPDGLYKPIDLNPLYAAPQPPTVELRKGKHIVAFMSLTCPHCKKAAYLLHIIHQEHPSMPIFFVLNGSSYYDSTFFKETNSRDVPHMMYRNTEGFLKLADAGAGSPEQGGVPAIYWINNGYIERKATYYQLDPKYMEQWLKQ